jgi:hypothetical protein
MATEESKEQNPAKSSSRQPASSVDFVDETDDMFDSPREMQGDGLLPRALRILAEVCKPYWVADRKAITQQNEHRHITKFALAFATASVSLAIFQLPFLGQMHGWQELIFPAIEAIAVVFTIYYVRRGLKLAVQKEWLLERHKAERFRFLKYRWLLDLVTKSKDDSGLNHWKSTAVTEASKILSMKEPDLVQWMGENHRVPKDDKSLHSVLSKNDFDTILEYYKRKRLDRQVSYHHKKSHATQDADSRTKRWPSKLFLASLVVALIHFGIDILDTLGKLGGEYISPRIAHIVDFLRIPLAKENSVILITLAALLPVAVATIRTYRSANEYSRNTVRFAAMYLELKEASDGLAEMPDNTRKLRTLWQSEESLEDEHRQWLRLMDDAEWYG